MGERVQVRTTRAESVNPPDDGVRIDYAKSDVNPSFPTFRRALLGIQVVVTEAIRFARPRLAALLIQLGGPRQIAFALGLAMILGAVGGAIDHRGSAGFNMWLGGLIVGFAIPIKQKGG